MEDNDLHYSDDSGFGREVADDSDFERDDLDFTTDDGSSIFSRALTSIESLGALMKVRKHSEKPAKSEAISIKENNTKPKKKKKANDKKAKKGKKDA